MVIESRLMTAEEFEALPSDEVKRELVRGVVNVEMLSGGEHGLIASILGAHFWHYLYAHPIGLAAGRAGYVLHRSPDTVRAPDAAVVLHSNQESADIPRGFMSGAPDFAVEIVSPSDSATSVTDKVADWLEAGAQLVWVIYPSRPRLVAHYADGRARTFGPDDQVDALPVLPGFAVHLRDLLRPPQK